ncbi:MAG: histidine phosphatase family protein [Pseudomonadota bacterium]
MSESKRSRASRGPIIISRHGRPALDRSAGPKLDWRAYVEWWDAYEAGGLAEGQAPPPDLVKAVSNTDLVLSSVRKRAVQTALLATEGREPTQDALFNEAPLPPPRLPGQRYLPKTWNILARMAWLQGHSLDGESVSEARRRAIAAAECLDTYAQQGSVYLAAHGWFNRMLRRPLRGQGWVCVRDGGDKYWSFRVYEYRGKSKDEH